MDAFGGYRAKIQNELHNERKHARRLMESRFKHEREEGKRRFLYITELLRVANEYERKD